MGFFSKLLDFFRGRQSRTRQERYIVSHDRTGEHGGLSGSSPTSNNAASVGHGASSRMPSLSYGATTSNQADTQRTQTGGHGAMPRILNYRAAASNQVDVQGTWTNSAGQITRSYNETQGDRVDSAAKTRMQSHNRGATTRNQGDVKLKYTTKVTTHQLNNAVIKVTTHQLNNAAQRRRDGHGGSSREQSLCSRATAENKENSQKTFASRLGSVKTVEWSEGSRSTDKCKGRTHRSNDNGQKRHHNNVIGYHKLKNWANETDTGKLVLWIANESDALTDLLKGDIKPDWFSFLVKICGLILSASHQRQALTKVLSIIITSHFLDQGLYSFVNEKIQNPWPEARTFYEEVLVIIKQIVNLFPEYAIECSVSLSLLRKTVSETRQRYEDTILRAITELQEDVKRVEKKNHERKTLRRKAMPFIDTDIPPEDFRILPVIPEISDLTSQAEPFVRAVLAKGAYRDLNHYLDVQFRLMREDFVQPLREGINEFKEKGCKKDFKSSDIHLYFNVQIIGMTTVSGINHVLQFDVKSLKSVKWENSKRFLNGSLLCLSKDNFESVLFATVAFRDIEHLKNGIVNVEFKTGLETIFTSSSSEIFVMAETTAYFEAYSPVLEGLKEIRSNNSLQKYFIYCQNILQPPKYLLGGVRKYDLSNLTKSGKPTNVPVLNTLSWPPVEKMNVNESQREAVQLALTKELAIIQGPPGTGKTYVALKIMRILLENQTNMAINDINQHDPILVVCYTNHALDQFLEGVVQFCPEGVVRVGGNSSSTVMENRNLKKLKMNQVPGKSVKRALWETKTELQRISNTIGGLKMRMDSVQVDIVHENILKQYMNPAHYKSLMARNPKGFSKKNDFQMRYWLHSLKTFDRDALPHLIKKRFTKLVLQLHDSSVLNTDQSPSEMRKAIQSMSVIKRAHIYQGWLYRFRLELDMSDFKNVLLLRESQKRILHDVEIRCVIPDIIFSCIHSLNHSVNNEAVECWLLGLDRSLSDQLDDIENLIQYFSQDEQNGDDDYDDEDGSLESQNARIINTDQTEEEGIAKETMRVKEEDVFLILKAEKLGIVHEDVDIEYPDDNSWNTVTHHKSLSFSKIRYCLTSIKPMTEDEEEGVKNVSTLDLQKRFALYNLWVQRYQSELAEEMEDLVIEYKQVMKERQEIRMENDLDILRQARVIGMTTTGAAKYRALLQAVACRIIVVEEAAEVLEAHIITALNENCKHLILIGDHQQLRPNPTVYTLAKDYHLDLSLFERLINNGIQHVTLKEQHRMRQSISKIMRHIYPDLQDHISVTRYENVRGMGKNTFFINHKKHESAVCQSKSKSNTYEASFLVALLKYFLLQGYESNQITILATYAGQILTLKNELKEKEVGESIRVTTVDNFQGEENDIILLSLVRSNDQHNIGFLKTDNRVCVALSRAKKGLFAIGNFGMLSSKSKLWEQIVQTAKDDDIYGDALPVVCPNHPCSKIEICSPGDFVKKCPEGGCGRPCEFRLQCGHTCHLKCHGYDSKHEKVKCNKRCAKTCPQGHPCKKKCFLECGNCTEIVEKIIPRCGHADKIPCHISAQDAVCSQPCGVLLECLHHCTGKCGDCHENKEHAKCRMHCSMNK